MKKSFYFLTDGVISLDSTKGSNVERLVKVFFKENNQVEEESILEDGPLFPWIDRLRKNPPKPTVLPYKKEDNIIWYGVAFKDRDFNFLRSDLMAFIGPSYSNLTGKVADLNSEDPRERVLEEVFGEKVVRFFGKTRNIWDGLELMREIWDEKPEIEEYQVKSIGRVLRDFFMAIQTKNRGNAEKHLEYLKEHALLDGKNISFLRIQMLSGLSLWEEILDSKELPNIIRIRKPLSVKHAIMKAIYFTEFFPFESNFDVEGALNHFKKEINPKYGALFENYTPTNDKEVLKLYMLNSVGGEKPDPEIQEEILGKKYIGKKDRDFLEKIASMQTVDLIRDPGMVYQVAEKYFNMGKFQQALKFSKQIDDLIKRFQLTLRCALELQTLQAKKIVEEIIEEMDMNLREKVFESKFVQISIMDLGIDIGELDQKTPNSWIDWIKRIKSDQMWGEASKYARLGVEEWNIEELLENEKEKKEFIRLLTEEKSKEIEQTLEESLPYLIMGLMKDINWPRREFKEIYASLIDWLVMTTDGGEDDLQLLNELISAQLSLGIERNSYKELIGYIQELWDNFKSPIHVSWAVDFLEILTLYPVIDENEAEVILNQIISSLGVFYNRLTEFQILCLKQICDEFNKKEIFEEILLERREPKAPQKVDFGDLDIEVGIYTLSERVGNRVKSIIEEIYPSLRVFISNDKSGSERLKQKARNVDVFLIAYNCAKHAATEFIKNHRPKNSETIWVKGKGSASILSDLQGYISKIM